jgi:hypothetical protein
MKDFKMKTDAHDMPNFLVIGAMKSGTTALYNFLNQHPQIYMSPIKEPHFFSLAQSEFAQEYISRSPSIVATLEDYKKLFQGVTDEIALGECSPSYLNYPEAAQNIHKSLPNIRIIAILRNPIDRAFSHYWHQVQIGETQPTQFIDAFWQDDLSHTAHGDYWESYKVQSMYGEHISRYIDLFGPDQVRVYIYEEYAKNPQKVMSDIYQWLGVDDQFEPQYMRFWGSGQPRSRILYRFLKKPNPVKALLKRIVPNPRLRQRMKYYVFNRNLKKTETLTPEIRRQLIPVFRDDIKKLEALIHRDLSAWLAEKK